MRRIVTAIVALLALAFAQSAAASQLIDRDATSVRLAANARGQALLTYRARGRIWHVLAWGAIDARHPDSHRPQVRFRKNYSGGAWQTFRKACRRYDGPPISFLVTACRASDGSYWALQSWQTPLPDLGLTPWLPVQRAWELHLSHWRGPLAKIEVWTDWIYGGRFHDLFGRVSYAGRPVYGFGTTRVGAPTDGYGRLVYLDTFDSRYGKGWRRENSFVAHNPTGMFCYGFYPFDPTRGYPHPAGYPSTPRGPGNGEKYRLTISGPGVTPDVTVVVPGLHDFDRNNPGDVAYEQQQNRVLDSIVGVDKLCRRH
jgi:type II secretory pathway pseudopilin PulG